MLNKSLDIVDRLINFVMIVFFLLLILVGGYAFFDSYQIYDAAKLDAEILNLKPKREENYTFEGLREINPDVEGWITMFETTIDYPVIHSKDNLDYLNVDYKGNYSAGGSIFSDYRNTLDFKDDYTILYGHNMATGQMFSDIKKYENVDYFNQHLYGVLYTVDDVYKLEVLDLARVNAYQDDIYNLITYANGRNEELAELVRGKSRRSNLVDGREKLVLLSTCDSYGSNDRTVLLVKATGTNSEEIQAIEESVKESLVAQGGDGEVSGVGLPVWLGHFWGILPLLILVVVVFRVIKKWVRKIWEKKKSEREPEGSA